MLAVILALIGCGAPPAPPSEAQLPTPPLPNAMLRRDPPTPSPLLAQPTPVFSPPTAPTAPPPLPTDAPVPTAPAEAAPAEPTPEPPPPLDTAPPEALPPEVTPPPPPEAVAGDWLQGDLGVELRLLTLAVPSNGANAPITVLRLDPNLVRLRVGYAPGAPRALSQWQADSGALAVINGGFFSPEFTALGVTVSGGQAQGESLAFGGMFAVDVNGAVSLRNLADQPYDGSEPLQEALQSFPILVRAPGEPAQIRENGERNRRTVVALDEAGRVLLIVAPTPAWTLQDMGDALAASDLGVTIALNLDGGSSTGMLVASGAVQLPLPAFSTLPQVLLVERR
jgi:uncharacterized protein YigE (DUF2233 family)